MKKKERNIQPAIPYFTKFPNKYIQSDIQSVFGINRKFYITYILIDRNRSREDFSWITIRKIFDFYGYQTTRNKPQTFMEIIDVLKYMIDQNMIQVKNDLDSIGYNDLIEIKIISENFDCTEKFTKITANQIDTIMSFDSSVSKENILLVFLYVNSYIGCRKQSENTNDDEKPEETNPEAFWRSIQRMSKDIAMAKKTIVDCLAFLTEKHKSHDALLIKYEVGYIPQPGNKPPKNAPNIYVLNQNGYQREIQSAINKMKELYNVDYFIQKEKKTENT